MKKIRKFAAALLALLMVGTCLAACSEKKPGSSETGGATTGGTTATTAYKADIPEGTTYNGAVFNISVFGENKVVWGDVDFSATAINGEEINDATYKRTQRVETDLDIDIVAIPGETICGGLESVKKSVLAQEGAYRLAFLNIRAAGVGAGENYLYDMNNMSELDLSAAWWDQNAVNELSVNRRLFMLTGDIEIMYKKSIGVILFNKQLATDYNTGNLYDMVDNKTWTIEKLVSLSKLCHNDLNNDNKYTKDDLYGFLYYADIAALGVIGGGSSFAAKDPATDLPEINFYNERTVGILDQWFDLFYDEQVSFADDNENVLKPMFMSDKALFDYNEFHAIEQLREMDTDFGILPIPLYEENQERYYHSINPHVGSVLTVPSDNDDLTMTAYVMDSLGAASKNILTPAYYEKYLKGKGARDDESEVIIDLVLSTVKYDMGYMYDWGSLSDLPLDMVVAKSTNVSSYYTKLSKKAQTAMDKMISKIQNLE